MLSNGKVGNVPVGPLDLKRSNSRRRFNQRDSRKFHKKRASNPAKRGIHVLSQQKEMFH
uniref:Uncharacterized protein n=1 Tax=Fusarium oxysporum (strain Fo5176) TaxID=660025 RepID=A0A0D2XNI5_FUSOF